MALINFSGIASGIDSAALIEALLEKRRAASVSPLQTKVTQLTGTNDSLRELKDLLGALNTAAYRFRDVAGTVLSKLTSSSDEENVDATASNAAMNGTYTLNVTSLAKNASFSAKSSSGAYGSSSDAISAGSAFSDSVTIQVGPDSAPTETIAITVTETTTLSEFVTSFNSQSTKATASLVNIGTSSSADYRIMINTNNTGVDEGSLKVTVGGALSARGAFDSNTLDDASNAAFTITGVGDPIVRQTNSISDVIPGLTFNLHGTGAASIAVQDDAATTADSLRDFVDAYNRLASYIRENDQVTQEGEGEKKKMVFGSLASTTIDENMLSSIRRAMTESATSGESVNVLADLGITTQRDGSLKFDESVFEDAIGANPEAIRTITRNLGEALSAVDGTIAQFTRFNGVLDSSINSNATEISRSQARIADLESELAKEQQQLTARFSRLEALIGRLQSQQTSLSQVLPPS